MNTRLYYDHVLVHPRDTAELSEHLVLPSALADNAHGDDLELIRKRNTLCLGVVVAISPRLPIVVKQQVDTDDKGEPMYDYVRRAGAKRPDCEVGEQVLYQRAGGAIAQFTDEDLDALELGAWKGKELVLVREQHIFLAVAGDVVQELGGIRSA